MIRRPSQASLFKLVQAGLDLGQRQLTSAQQKVATGKRILRPSDDSIGTAVAMAARRQKGSIQAFQSAITTARPLVEGASSHLEQASGVMIEARALLLQGMNGTYNDADRATIANALDDVFRNMLELANGRLGGRYLFSGTATGAPPFEQGADGRVRYRGNDDRQAVVIGRGVEVDLNVTGGESFDRFEYSGVRLDGTTGVALGTSASSGVGYHDLRFRHDATLGAPGAGIALAAGGAGDTILGDHTVTVDATAGTAQLGSGAVTVIPAPLPTDLTLTDADGSSVVLDFSGWTGADTTFVLTGAGSVALNDGPYQALTLAETDLELVDEALGVALHVDTTAVTRAATELVIFAGTANVFDTLRGFAQDLRDADQVGDVIGRLNQRLAEFDRNHENLLISAGEMGSRANRLDRTESHLSELGQHFDQVVSGVEDADITEAILELGRAEQTLQAARGTGARLIEQTLLNFLR